MLCFRKLLVAKILWIRGGGGVTKIPSKISCLKVPKDFVEEPFSLSLVSGIEKIYGSEGYVTILRLKFLSHSAENFRRGTLLWCVSENFWWRKSLWIRRGECQNFPLKIFCPKVQKKFGSFINFGHRKICLRGWGECQDIPSKISCLRVPKIFVGNPSVLCFRKLLVAKKFMDKKGGGIDKIFRRKFFV